LFPFSYHFLKDKKFHVQQDVFATSSSISISDCEHADNLVTDHAETPEEISPIKVIYQSSSNADRRAGIQHKFLASILWTTCFCQ